MTHSPRVLAVDVFRGITILMMILVNNPGNWGKIYAPLRHADWHGWTPTDLVFPFFLFIVGVSISLALGGKVAAGAPTGKLLVKILRRSLLLFAIGLLLSSLSRIPAALSGDFSWLGRMRIPGVLQRIALCYLAAALLFLKTPVRVWGISIVVLLGGYWVLMTMVPLPDGRPSLLDDKSQNLAAYIDRWVLGDHLWRASKTWDPEGILSTLPALATTLLGVAAGLTIRRQTSPGAKAVRLAVAGVMLTAAGWCWSEFGGFPINKPLWTSSYAVFTAGLAMLSLAVCLVVVDVLQLRRLVFPFEVYGKNALTVFVLSAVVGRALAAVRFSDGAGGEVSAKAAIYSNAYTSWITDPYLASLAFALTWVLGFYLVLLWMFRRNFVLKL